MEAVFAHAPMGMAAAGTASINVANVATVWMLCCCMDQQVQALSTVSYDGHSF